MVNVTHICQACGAITTRDSGDALCRKCVREGKEPDVPKEPSLAKSVWVDGYNGKIEHVAGEVWRVFSESSDKAYNVDLGVPNCTCTDWATKRNKLVHDARVAGKSDKVRYECKHVRAAQAAAHAQHLSNTGHGAAMEEAERIRAEARTAKTRKEALAMLKDLKEGR